MRPRVLMGRPIWLVAVAAAAALLCSELSYSFAAPVAIDRTDNVVEREPPAPSASAAASSSSSSSSSSLSPRPPSPPSRPASSTPAANSGAEATPIRTHNSTQPSSLLKVPEGASNNSSHTSPASSEGSDFAGVELDAVAVAVISVASAQEAGIPLRATVSALSRQAGVATIFVLETPLWPSPASDADGVQYDDAALARITAERLERRDALRVSLMMMEMDMQQKQQQQRRQQYPDSVADGLPPLVLIRDQDYARGSCATAGDAVDRDLSSCEHGTLGDALNFIAFRHPLSINTTHVLVVSPFAQPFGPENNFVTSLVRACAKARCSAAGPVTVDGTGRIYSRGVGVALGALPKKASHGFSYGSQSSRNWWSSVPEDNERSADDVNIPIPFLRAQGRHLDFHSESSLEAYELKALSSVVVLIPKASLELLGGFTASCEDALSSSSIDVIENCTSAIGLPLPFLVADWCMRGLANNLTLTLVGDSFWQYSGPTEQFTTADGGDDVIRQSLLWLNASFGADLRDEIEGRYDLPDIVLVWNGECGTGQVMGFTTEMLGFILGLDGRLPLKLELSDLASCIRDLKAVGLPSHHIVTLERLANVRFTDLQSLEFTGNGTTTVLVLHRDPGRYQTFLSASIASDADVIVGRSMFETDSIPKQWKKSCNSAVDEIWVPSAFNVETFSRAGVERSRLVVIPEAVDGVEFDRDSRHGLSERFRSLTRFTFEEPLLSVLDPLDAITHTVHHDSASFRFLSIMKWEERKAWDTLLGAYFAEFTGRADVALYIRANMDASNWRQLDDFIADYLSAECSDNATVEKCVQELLAVLPTVYIVREKIPYTRMADLFASSDCFVLASRGEGWGLPLAEAMAMGIPVIATNWSGNTEFMSSDNSFLVPVEAMKDHPSEIGHKWAQPSEALLRQQMRVVLEGHGQEQVKTIVDHAQTDINENFCPHSVGSEVIRALSALKLRAFELKAARDARELQRTEEVSRDSAALRFKIKINQ